MSMDLAERIVAAVQAAFVLKGDNQPSPWRLAVEAVEALLPAASAPAPCGHAGLLRDAAAEANLIGWALTGERHRLSRRVLDIADTLRAAAEAAGPASGWVEVTDDPATWPNVYTILCNEWWSDSNRASHRLMTPESLRERWTEIHGHPAFVRLEWMPWPASPAKGARGG